jgi:multisubunit Na+/H+ antiporter MnhC subunit
MGNLVKALIGLSALAFAVAVVTVFSGPLMGTVPPESYSRASTNLALLAIALVLTFDRPVGTGRSL